VFAYGTEPRVALLDGNLLKACPTRPFLDAALDAITHACESLWVRNRSLITDALAEKALRTFFAELPKGITERDPASLQALMEASSTANLACGNSGLGLVHALSSAPGVKLPHGYQNGALLLAVAAFNRPYLPPAHQQLIDQLGPLFKTLNWEGKYAPSDVGDQEAKMIIAASTGHAFRANNIRPSTDQELYAILKDSGAQITV